MIDRPSSWNELELSDSTIFGRVVQADQSSPRNHERGGDVEQPEIAIGHGGDRTSELIIDSSPRGERSVDRTTRSKLQTRSRSFGPAVFSTGGRPVRFLFGDFGRVDQTDAKWQGIAASMNAVLLAGLNPKNRSHETLGDANIQRPVRAPVCVRAYLIDLGSRNNDANRSTEHDPRSRLARETKLVNRCGPTDPQLSDQQRVVGDVG